MTIIEIQQLPQQNVLYFLRSIGELLKWSFQVGSMTVVN